MALIYAGVYHWRPRRRAVRDDWCISCALPQPAQEITTIDVVHLYGIPLLPIGRLGRWYCLRCGEPPDAVWSARRSLKWAVFAITALVAVLLWIEPLPDAGLSLTFWSIRIAFTAGALASLWWIARGSDDVERRRRLAELVPNHLPLCPLCATPMRPGDKWRCEHCGVIHKGRAQ